MRRFGLVMLLMCGLAGFGPAVAADNPYAPALLINDGVITHYDIQQRMALLEALGATGDLQKLAIQQLTEDRVKVQAGKLLGIELPDGAIQTGIEEFAGARGLTMDDVDAALTARKIDRQSMDDFVEAGLIWREVVVAKFRARATPSDTDLDEALALAARTPMEMVTMAEIALPFAERGEAQTLELADRLYRELSRGASFPAAAREYSRSGTAEKGGTLPDMPITQLPPAIRGQVLLMRPGQVTRPMPIGGGVALLKLVSIHQGKPAPARDANDPAVRDAMRQQLFSDRINSFGQGYLQELLSDALITPQ